MAKALVIFAFVSGCGNKPTKNLEQLDRLRAKICACDDAGCIAAVRRDIDAWEHAAGGDGQDKAWASRHDDITSAITVCTAELPGPCDKLKPLIDKLGACPGMTTPERDALVQQWNGVARISSRAAKALSCANLIPSIEQRCATTAAPGGGSGTP